MTTTYETELSVSYYAPIDQQRDDLIISTAAAHGFSLAGCGAMIDGSQRDLTFTRQGILSQGERYNLGIALTVAGNIDADLDIWKNDGSEDEPVGELSLLTIQ